MANPYFRNLPEFDYVDRTRSGGSIGDYTRVKNLFKKGVLRQDIFQDLSFFTKYIVEGDDRPDNVAEIVYGDTGTLPKGDVEEQLQLSDKEIFEPAKILNQATRRYNQLSLYSVDIEIGLDLSYKVGDTVEIELKSLNQHDDGERNKMVGGKYLVMSLRHTLLTKNAVTRLGLVRDSIGRKVESSGMVVGVA